MDTLLIFKRSDALEAKLKELRLLLAEVRAAQEKDVVDQHSMEDAIDAKKISENWVFVLTEKVQ